MNYENRLKCPHEFSNNEFKAQVFYFYNEFIPKLKSLGIYLKPESYDHFFITYFDQILQNFDEKNVYSNLPNTIRSPHLIAAAVIYFILETQFDFVITKKFFSSCLSLNYSKITDCVNFFIKNYFTIDESEYDKKIFHYVDIILEFINKTYDLDLSKHIKKTVLRKKIIDYYTSLKKNVIYIPEDILKKLNSSQQKLYKILNTNGFNINILSKNLKYDYFLPQYLALALIYFCKDLSPIKSKRVLSYVELSEITGYSGKKIQNIVTLFRFNIENVENHRYYHAKYYSEEHFVHDLEALYDETKRLDFLFLLEAFRILGLTPNEFSQDVVSYVHIKGESCSARTLISLLRDKISSIGSYAYNKMVVNIKHLYEQNKITKENMDKALLLIQYADNIKNQMLFHNSVKYSFTFNKNNLNKISNSIIKAHLETHFLKIQRDNYPQQLFNDEISTSGSLFYIKGTNDEPLLSSDLKKLIRQLNNSRKIGPQQKGFFGSFSKIAEKTFTAYLDRYGVVPNHHPILNSLITKENIIAIEVPVWAITRGSECFFGHIDVLGYYKGKIVIGDYKTSENEIFRSIPQISIYAYLLKAQFKLPNFENIICLGFSKDVAWAFEPQLLQDIYKFVKIENAKRIENLKCKSRSSVGKDLAQEIEKILSI